MRKSIIPICILCLCLAGCSNPTKTPDKIDSLNNIPDSVVENHDTIISTPKPEYGADNEYTESIYQYNSGIVIGSTEVIVGEPYNYQGNTFSGESKVEDIKEPVQNDNDSNSVIKELEERLASLHEELAFYLDPNTGDIKVEPFEGEDYDSAKARVTSEYNYIISSIEETEKAIEIEKDKINNSNLSDNTMDANKALEEIKRFIINDVYYNGLYVINSCESIEQFSKTHSTSIETHISSIKRGLERVERCESNINNYLSDNAELVSIWKDFKEYLISWRTEFANIKSGEDYINAGLRVDSKEMELLSKLEANLVIVN